jgi:hypothetical protein
MDATHGYGKGVGVQISGRCIEVYVQLGRRVCARVLGASCFLPTDLRRETMTGSTYHMRWAVDGLWQSEDIIYVLSTEGDRSSCSTARSYM